MNNALRPFLRTDWILANAVEILPLLLPGDCPEMRLSSVLLEAGEDLESTKIAFRNALKTLFYHDKYLCRLRLLSYLSVCIEVRDRSFLHGRSLIMAQGSLESDDTLAGLKSCMNNLAQCLEERILEILVDAHLTLMYFVRGK